MPRRPIIVNEVDGGAAGGFDALASQIGARTRQCQNRRD
jgi:hypothetical protein